MALCTQLQNSLRFSEGQLTLRTYNLIIIYFQVDEQSKKHGGHLVADVLKVSLAAWLMLQIINIGFKYPVLKYVLPLSVGIFYIDKNTIC